MNKHFISFYICIVGLKVSNLIVRQKPILSQNFKFIFRIIFSGHLFVICSCTFIRGDLNWRNSEQKFKSLKLGAKVVITLVDLAIGAAPNTSIHMSRSLHNHFKERSKRLLQHLLLNDTNSRQQNKILCKPVV